ncbi:MAG: hypothetical protein FXF47_09165 [Candidatus Mcinerneyibacterium aminivorans]|uniref:Uncharacterized protein n=1 Tax=Candidatus Mcinerneyibacterium aminivorans TaxID=2703815 RepID=A0A5D0MG47_9BACT|nr:MAG: hypothetical protein FXF47_09165 [Candidatus Mcinerneyibacterium aminivorans]
MAEDKNEKKWYDYLLTIKKPLVYLGMFLVVIIPFLSRCKLKTYETDLVKKVFTRVEKIHEYNKEHPDSKRGILLGFDYGPSTTPENDPMLYAVLRHAFLRDIPVVAWAPYVAYLQLAEGRIKRIAKEYKAEYGKDYVFMGLAYPPTPYMISTGTDMRPMFNTDYYGNDVYKLPILDRFNNYDAFGLVVTISGTAMPEVWLRYANSLYNQDVAVATTAVNAAKFYAYAASGQFTGMIAGLKGAAEYEQMVTRLENKVIDEDIKEYLTGLYKNVDKDKYPEKYYEPEYTKSEINTAILRRRQAGRGMSSQFGAHVYVIILIIIGNVGYYFKRRDEKRRKTGKWGA